MSDVMWLDELQACLARGLTRPVAWEPLEAVFPEAEFRRVVGQLIALRRDAGVDGDRAKRVAILPHDLQQLAVRWLTTNAYDGWVRYVYRHIRDVGSSELDIIRATIQDLLCLGLGLEASFNLFPVVWKLKDSLAFYPAPSVPEDDALRYLHELRLMRDGQTTALGRVMSRLSGRDAVKWLLLVELLQSTGPGDPWRVSLATIQDLLDSPRLVVRTDKPGNETSGEDDYPHSWATLWRLQRLNLLAFNFSEHQDGYELWPEGALILREILSPELPMRGIAGALLEQDAASLVTGRAYVEGVDRRAAEWVIETMAHGLRNALGPVRFAVDEIAETSAEVGRSPAFERIRGGLARSFKLVDDLVALHRASSAPVETFDVAAALRDVVAAANGSGVTLDVSALAGASLRGQRLRFVHALVDLVHNARRHARPDVSLTIRVSAHRAGDRLTVAVDDSGTGVPAALRRRIFEPGFSTHPEGTGQGLALLDEVVRNDHRGTVEVQESPLGGARFVLSLPLERAP